MTMTDYPMSDAAPAAAEQSAPLQIDFLYWEDCPSHEQALAMLQDVLRDEDVPADIRLQRVDSDEEARLWRFPGSPTIRVNGLDIDANPALPVGLACRAYRRDDGRISPLPPRSAVVRAIDQARRGDLSAGAGEAAS